ncbi:MAG: radical SAM protein [Clostridia bacterium]|nr:radical SAM protein [Clostridia bacterium]
MSRKHANIAIFVPHIGCPNKCSFCDQRYITGVRKAPRPADVAKAVKKAVKSRNFDKKTAEIAFFGGSFTAINRGYMLDLLEAAFVFVKDKTVSGIRISTRPDAIDHEILEILKQHGVTSIELGAQSMNDLVLQMNNRGHTAADVEHAARMIRQAGFELGLQMMTGLYGDTPESALQTAERLIALSPDTVRIYPTLVLKDTDLAALYADGIYRPQTLDDAVLLAEELYRRFTSRGVRVIRLGLHAVEKDAFLAGPWHPAFSELCQSRILLNDLIPKLSEPGKYLVLVAKSDVSKMIGQGRKNLLFLQSKGYDCRVEAADGFENLQFEVRKEV